MLAGQYPLQVDSNTCSKTVTGPREKQVWNFLHVQTETCYSSVILSTITVTPPVLLSEQHRIWQLKCTVTTVVFAVCPGTLQGLQDRDSVLMQ